MSHGFGKVHQHELETKTAAQAFDVGPLCTQLWFDTALLIETETLVVIFSGSPSTLHLSKNGRDAVDVCIISSHFTEVEAFFEASYSTVRKAASRPNGLSINLHEVPLQSQGQILHKLALTIPPDASVTATILRNCPLRDLSHALTVTNFVIKSVAVAHVKNVLDIKHALTLRLTAKNHPKFERLVVLSEIRIHCQGFSGPCRDSQSKALVGTLKFPEANVFSFLQVTMPKESLQVKPEFKQFLANLHSYGLHPIEFVGRCKGGNEEYFHLAWACPADSEKRKILTEVIKELRDEADFCKHELQTYANVFYFYPHSQENVYIRFVNTAFPHLVQHFEQYEHMYVDHNVMIVSMPPLAYEKFEQDCKARSVAFPANVIQGISTLSIVHDTAHCRIQVLKPAGGLPTIPMQFRPVDVCFRQLSEVTKMSVLQEIKDIALGVEPAPVEVRTAGGIKTVLVCNVSTATGDWLSKQGTMYCLQGSHYVLELADPPLFMPTALNSRRPEESAYLHQTNLAHECKTKNADLQSQSQLRHMQFLPHYEKDNKANKISEGLNKACKYESSSTSILVQNLPENIQADFCPKFLHATTEVQSPHSALGTEMLDKLLQKLANDNLRVGSAITTTVTKTTNAKQMCARLSSGIAATMQFGLITIIGQHFLTFRMPRADTSLGATKLEHLTTSTVLLPATHLHSLIIKPSTSDALQICLEPVLFAGFAGAHARNTERSSSPGSPKPTPNTEKVPAPAASSATRVNNDTNTMNQQQGFGPPNSEHIPIVPPAAIPVPDDADMLEIPSSIAASTVADSSESHRAHDVHTDLPTNACPLFVALRVLTFVRWSSQDANNSFDWHLLKAVGQGQKQTDPSLRDAILHLLAILDPQTAAQLRQGQPPLCRDALELLDQLSARLLAPKYALSELRDFGVCTSCLQTDEKFEKSSLLSLGLNAKKREDVSEASLLQSLLTEGLSYDLKYTCKYCQKTAVEVTRNLHGIADILVVQTSTLDCSSLPFIQLKRPISSTRGGQIEGLRLKAIIWYNAAIPHYFMQEYDDQQCTSFYDPLVGITSEYDLSSSQHRAHVYVPVFATPAKSRKLPAFNSAHLKQLVDKYRKRCEAKLKVKKPHLKTAHVSPTKATSNAKRLVASQNTSQTANKHSSASKPEPPQSVKQSSCSSKRDHQKQVAVPYGLISLFDGLGTLQQIFTDILGRTPVAVLAAETDPALRCYVASRLGLNASHCNWQKQSSTVPTCYLQDVWTALDDDARPLREFLGLLPPEAKIFLGAGSPCQDVTVAGESKGTLGFTGPRSFHVHAIYCILQFFQSCGMLNRVFLLLENAGSIHKLHEEYLTFLFGLEPHHIKRLDAKDWSAAVRNRIYITDAVGFVIPAVRPLPFEANWSPLPDLTKGAKTCVKLPPWLQSRGTTPSGNVIRTATAYKMQNLVYHLPTFGGLAGLERLLHSGRLAERVQAYVPQPFVDAWLCMQAPEHGKGYSTQTDEAARTLADLFENPAVFLPFRPPSLKEQLEETELENILHYYDTDPCVRPSEEKLMNFIGNYFKPSAVAAVITGHSPDLGCVGFCTNKPYPRGVRKLPPPRLVTNRFELLKKKVEIELQRNKARASIQPVAQYVPNGKEHLLTEEFYAYASGLPQEAPDVVIFKNPLSLCSALDMQLLRAPPPITVKTFPLVPQKLHDKFHTTGLGHLPSVTLTSDNIHKLLPAIASDYKFTSTSKEGFCSELITRIEQVYNTRSGTKMLFCWKSSDDKPLAFLDPGCVKHIDALFVSNVEVKLCLVAINQLVPLSKASQIAQSHIDKIVQTLLAMTSNQPQEILYKDFETAVYDASVLVRQKLQQFAVVTRTSHPTSTHAFTFCTRTRTLKSYFEPRRFVGLFLQKLRLVEPPAADYPCAATHAAALFHYEIKQGLNAVLACLTVQCSAEEVAKLATMNEEENIEWLSREERTLKCLQLTYPSAEALRTLRLSEDALVPPPLAAVPVYVMMTCQDTMMCYSTTFTELRTKVAVWRQVQNVALSHTNDTND